MRNQKEYKQMLETVSIKKGLCSTKIKKQGRSMCILNFKIIFKSKNMKWTWVADFLTQNVENKDKEEKFNVANNKALIEERPSKFTF